MKEIKFVKMVCMIFVFFASITSGAQTLTTLANFNITNGLQPLSSLVQGSDANFYGTTSGGGQGAYCSPGCGTIFKMAPNGNLIWTYSFCNQPNCADGGGGLPSGLVQATDGNFYGTTEYGGDALQCPYVTGCGTIFRITPNGVYTTIYSFCAQGLCPDGTFPLGGVIQASDGNFYGTTSAGGSCFERDCGTVFRITPAGTFTTLYSFCIQSGCPDGSGPAAGLTEGSDGNFYGTTLTGGIHVNGTVFEITPGGALTTLHTFNSDGSNPYGALAQGSDGNFYGTTSAGGVHDGGTVFKITSGGTLTTIHNFCSLPNCADGETPEGALVQATDGNFYGTTVNGGTGASEEGTVFQITPSGTLTTLYNFCSLSNCTDGAQPYAGVIQATNGTFYGVTRVGGNSTNCSSLGCGTVFQLGVSLNLPATQVVPITPCRLVDTRQNGGGGPIAGGTFEVFNLPQLSQSKGCGDLSSAATYSLNVTLVPVNNHPVSYLTIWPAGKSRPLVSLMNSLDGRTKANAAIVPAGASGAVSVYLTDAANVVIDIDGYFAPPSAQTLQFYPLTPCRVADTRSSTYPQGLGTPHLSHGVARDFPVLESSCIPQNVNAAAYSFNLTAIPYPALGNPLAYLEVWPTGNQPQNPVSTLNNPTGTYVANAAIVPAGTAGQITAFASDNTDLAIDINGYFAAAGTGGLSLYPTVPCRVIDTRKIGNGQPFTGTLSPPVDVVDSACGIPSTAAGYVFNATVVPSPSLSYLTLWPDGQNQPVVSTLNAVDGWITSNMAIVPSVNGKIDAYAAGMTQLILDISSYFAP